MGGLVVNRVGLSEVFGVSLVTVDAWRRRGCPYLKAPSKDKSASAKAREWEFNTADVATWLQNEAARRRW